MHKTLGEIARIIGGEVVGDAEAVITGFSGIKEAQAGDLTFIANPKYFSLLKTTKASAVIVPNEVRVDSPATIRTSNPSLAFAQAVSSVADFYPTQITGIHPTAVIGKDVRLGRGVGIGPYVVIEDGTTIGESTQIMSHVYVGPRTTIGDECRIYSFVSIRERVQLGHRVIIHSGTAIGSDGFGFVRVAAQHMKIPQIGTVVIEDDVEIGANVTIDRARFDKTVIGAGTKIDNLVQIAHNVRIGKNCIIVAQVGISGSTILEDDVILAGQAGLSGHITVGKGAVVAAQAGVSNSVPANTTVWGFPAKPHMHAKRVNAHVQRLPQTVKTIMELKERINVLESRLSQKRS